MKIILLTVICWFVFSPLPSRAERVPDETIAGKDKTTAQAPANQLEVYIIGSVFKSLAKSMILVSDIESVKKSRLEKIAVMNDKEFRDYYLDIYEHVYDCTYLIDNYGLRENMTKAQVSELIASLDKKKLFAIIDSLPNTVVHREVRRYIVKKFKAVAESDSITDIAHWTDMVLKNIKAKYIEK